MSLLVMRMDRRVPSIRSAAAETVGRRVRDLRLELGVSQEGLAELAGLHWSFVGQTERGLRNLTLHNLVKLAEALGVDPAELVRGLTLDDLPSEVREPSATERIREQRRR